MKQTEVYQSKNIIRFVTASSLFDGHDASINIMRRILQASGAEVIHLGHNRSAKEVVSAAIQEDVQAIAVSSYQGGHMEYFKYIINLLKEQNAQHIRLFGGGGGTIIPREVKELHDYGVTWIFTPEDGREMGLQGMINKMLEESDFIPPFNFAKEKHKLFKGNHQSIARFISVLENKNINMKDQMQDEIRKNVNLQIPVLGITGTGGAGKSSLTDELIRRFTNKLPNKNIAIISVDPTKRRTGGALLGARIRMNAIFSERIYMRSLATRGSKTELSESIQDVIDLLRTTKFDLIIVETSGIGQGDAAIDEISDLSMYVMTAEFGAPTQLEKIDMIDYADFITINKFEQKGSADALSQVRKQYERRRLLFHEDQEKFPIYGTNASQFNDEGVNTLFAAIIDRLNDDYGWNVPSPFEHLSVSEDRKIIIHNEQLHYLREISTVVKT